MNHILLLIFSSFVTNLLLLNKVEALPSEKILGGDEAPEGKFKYQVSVQANGEHECGGGIMDDKLIVTVAHCIVNKAGAHFNNKHYKVVATRNVFHLNETIASADVEKVYFLKTFDIFSFSNKSVLDSDEEFVILKLKEGLGLGNNPLLKSLKTSNTYSLRLSNTLVIAGYGVYSILYYRTTIIESKDGKLRYADAHIISNKQCSILHNATIGSFQLCARVQQIPDKPRGVCMGDSGGPLVKNNEVVIGIVISGSFTCSETVFPGIYMKISHYSTFIENVKKNNSSDFRVFSLIKNTSSGYTFIEDNNDLYESK